MSGNIKRTFFTTYMRDFPEKHAPRVASIKSLQEFKNPISGDLKDYLVIGKLHLNSNEEELEQFQNRFNDKYEKINQVHSLSTIDSEYVNSLEGNDALTTYQVDYDKIKSHKTHSRVQSQFHLPHDVYIPETEISYAFRNPITLNPDALGPQQPLKREGKLEALAQKAITGAFQYRTEYTDSIATRAEERMKMLECKTPRGES
ncbi:uncharacterized protein LOC126265040 [Aethina tumida]|uniref:uncharacterized protein LOC126265040 n=1 Tax=Aethina tumida TaxID=116153 RepID=UPI002147FA2C|nr:uncharacterized protein LOC126265040 [Aethina tumida]